MVKEQDSGGVVYLRPRYLGLLVVLIQISDHQREYGHEVEGKEAKQMWRVLLNWERGGLRGTTGRIQYRSYCGLQSFHDSRFRASMCIARLQQQPLLSSLPQTTSPRARRAD